MGCWLGHKWVEATVLAANIERTCWDDTVINSSGIGVVERCDGCGKERGRIILDDGESWEVHPATIRERGK